MAPEFAYLASTSHCGSVAPWGERPLPIKKDGTGGPVFVCNAKRAVARSVRRECDNRVAALGVNLNIAARCNDNVLLVADTVGGRRGIDTSAGVEGPQHFPVARVVGAEAAVGLAGEHDAARGRQNTAYHRLRG